MPFVTQPLLPKSTSGELFVIAIGRISTVHQNVENIEASYRSIQEYLDRVYQGPIKIKLLGEQASGMLTDRATIREAEELVARGIVDLVIAEDLSRIYRNPRYQYDFVQNAVDVGTRVICIGDNLDTADENWEVTMGAAALRHGLHIPDTRRRVRRTATYSFHKGGMVQKVRFGYRKLSAEEAASEQFGPKNLRIAKRPECTPILRDLMLRVIGGERYAALADWLNAEGIEPGPYVQGGRWTGRLVVELLNAPILSGTRTFRDTICRPVFRTGRHKPSKNAEPETAQCPELAHFSSQEHAELRRAISQRRSEYSSRQRSSQKRRGVPRSRSLWPGQAATCAVCGGLMYYSGPHLKCSNALKRRGARCWNHVQVPAQLTRERVISLILEQLEGDCSGRNTLMGIVRQFADKTAGSALRGRRDAAQEIAALERQAANLGAAIAAGGQLETLVQRLQTVETALKRARRAQASELTLEARSDEPKRPPATDLRETLLELTNSSFEFADVLRRIIPEFVIQPVQALDTPLVRPRGTLILRLDRLASTPADEQPPILPVEARWTVDLFEPPAHIRALRVCRAARAANPRFSLKQLGALLGLHLMTVKRAFDYGRLMEAMGAGEPYQEIHERPQRASRWNRSRVMPRGNAS